MIGPSGSGKSTLLQTAGLLDTPDSGRVCIGGCDAGTANDAERTRLRRIHIGCVYQLHHLPSELSAIENVSVPLLIAGRRGPICTTSCGWVKSALRCSSPGHNLHYYQELLAGLREAISAGTVEDYAGQFADAEGDIPACYL